MIAYRTLFQVAGRCHGSRRLLILDTMQTPGSVLYQYRHGKRSQDSSWKMNGFQKIRDASRYWNYCIVVGRIPATQSCHLNSSSSRPLGVSRWNGTVRHRHSAQSAASRCAGKTKQEAGRSRPLPLALLLPAHANTAVKKKNRGNCPSCLNLNSSRFPFQCRYLGMQGIIATSTPPPCPFSTSSARGRSSILFRSSLQMHHNLLPERPMPASAPGNDAPFGHPAPRRGLARADDSPQPAAAMTS